MSTAPPTTDYRAALAEFLRARREALSPSQVGLPAGRAAPHARPAPRGGGDARRACRSRGTRGSSRAGGSTPRPTCCGRSVERLRLDDAGIDHLTALGQPAPTQQPGVDLYGPDDVPSALRRLIDAFEPAPAYVLGPRWEFAAWNAAQARLYPRIETLAAEDRSLLWVLFADPSTRELIVDWDLHARQALAEFRASTTALRDDPLMVAMIERLGAASPEFDVLVGRARRRPLRDPPAPLQPSDRRPADVRVPAARPGRVAGAHRRRATPGPRRRLCSAPRRPPPRRLTPN